MPPGVEGKFKVKVEPDEDARKAGGKEYDDTLNITAAKFVSEEGKKHGFKETTYDEDSTRFGPATFTAESTSDTDGKMKWAGTVTVTEIEGTMISGPKTGLNCTSATRAANLE